MKISDVLIRARTRIATENLWAANTDALRHEERNCMLTALDPHVYEERCAAKSYLWKAIDEHYGPGDLSLAIFNDTHSHAQVLAAYDVAIALAVADEPREDSQS
jgi:hypothetical protein